MKEYVTSKYYANLYKFSSNLLEELISKKQNFIIISNCYSLIAGLTFDLLRKKTSNYCVMEFNQYQIKKIKEFNFIFLISKDDKTINCDLEYDYFFKYIGEESNILCIE